MKDGVEQLQWRSGASQLVLRQMKVVHGGRYIAVTQQALDGMDVHT